MSRVEDDELRAVGRIALEPTSPEAGAAAGLVVALAAGLVEAVARRSDHCWDEARAAVAQAVALRHRGLRLGGQDAEAHQAALEALAGATTNRTELAQSRADFSLGRALAAAADLPLEIATVASDVATLAALTAERGADEARADAAAAALLCAGAAAAAAHLVEINLATEADDERIVHARELVAQARAAGERALAEGR